MTTEASLADESGVEVVRKQLSDGVARIAALTPGKPADADEEAAIFNGFRRAVTLASSGREVPPEELLEDLEPKGPVLQHLLDLYERRRILRKQVAAVLAILLQEAGWNEALAGNAALNASVPAELRALIEDAATSAMTPKRLTTTPSDFGERVPTTRSEGMRPSVVEAMDALDLADQQLAKLDYSAAQDDPAIDAFEAFRRAVLKVVKSGGKEDKDALRQLEPKDRILDFLIDFHTRQPKYRSRVGSCLLRLLGFEEWAAAVEADPSVHAAIRDLTDDVSQPGRLTATSAGMAVNLAAAAAAVRSRGGAGALYVRVIAAYDLVNPGAHHSVDAYVRVVLGTRLKRTNSVATGLSPRWDGEPFVFEVPVMEATPDLACKFEVFDSDLMKDVPLGSLSIPARHFPRAPGLLRRPLAGVDRGELEVELVFMGDEEAGEARTETTSIVEAIEAAATQLKAQKTADIAQASWRGGRFAGWIVPQAGKGSESRSFSSAEGLKCPAGHPVEKRKEGLKWHEGWVGVNHSLSCDLCGGRIGREKPRWRCHFHCHFDVCEDCYARAAQATAVATEPGKD